MWFYRVRLLASAKYTDYYTKDMEIYQLIFVVYCLAYIYLTTTFDRNGLDELYQNLPPTWGHIKTI